MSGIFGGGPKRNKALEALQARERQDALRERNELEEEKSRVAGKAMTGRVGRSQLRSRRSSALKTALGV